MSKLLLKTLVLVLCESFAAPAFSESVQCLDAQCVSVFSRGYAIKNQVSAQNSGDLAWLRESVGSSCQDTCRDEKLLRLQVGQRAQADKNAFATALACKDLVGRLQSRWATYCFWKRRQLGEGVVCDCEEGGCVAGWTHLVGRLQSRWATYCFWKW
jgi:hypothetical protein